jgi:chromosomal replication initiation ATPase DnaA
VVPRPHQLIFDLPHVSAMSEADFVVDAGNRKALEHLLAWPDWPSPLVLLVGPEKAGKSHLAAIWAARATARMATPVEAAALLDGGPEPGTATSGGQAGGRQGLVNLVIEDADRGEFDEMVLFNLLDQAMRGGRHIVLTARREIKDWPLATEDVRSRLRLATWFPVAPLGGALLAQMFVKLFDDRQLLVEPGLIEYTMSRMVRSPAEVFALVDLMDRIGLAKKQRITKAIAASALSMREAGGVGQERSE